MLTKHLPLQWMWAHWLLHPTNKLKGLVDLDQMKTTGKLFGYEGDDFGRLTNAPLGAYATVLNITEHH